MPITKNVNDVVVYTAKKSLRTTTGEDTGVTRQSDFAVCGDDDFTRQVQFDLSDAPSGTKITFKAGASVQDENLVFTLPTDSSALGGSSNPVVGWAIVPVQGANVSFLPGRTVVFIQSEGGNIENMNINLPENPTNNMVVTIATQDTVTSCTITPPDGTTLATAITSMAAGTAVSYTYFEDILGWFISSR